MSKTRIFARKQAVKTLDEAEIKQVSGGLGSTHQTLGGTTTSQDCGSAGCGPIIIDDNDD